ncbi:MAG: DNA polymerase III subunit [Prevotella sp.]
MKFSEVIGQHEISKRMMQMVADEKVPHALMLCGPAGCGKLAVALAMASYLLGDRDESANANAAAMLAKFQHPDLHFVYPVIRPAGTSSEKKITSDDFTRQWTSLLTETAYFSFEEWLNRMEAVNQQAQIFAAEGDVITHKLSLKSSQGGYKVCLIWLPERMHTTFANKILKLLEEPPAQTVFILVSEEPHLLLETIRSRVQRIDLRRIDDEDIEKALMAKRGLDAGNAHRITRIANGNWLKAKEMLDASNENNQFLDMFIMLMRMAYARNTKGMKKWTDTVSAFGREKQRRMLKYFSLQVRENFMTNFGNPQLTYQTEEEETFSKNFARFINEANVIEIQELIDHTIRAIGQNANAKMQFFDFALKMIVLIIKK